MMRLATVAWLAALALPAAAQDVLVTTDWVNAHARRAGVRIVEVSVDPGVYEKGHVQGAVGWKWHSQLCDPVNRDVVSADNFARLCSSAGISNDTTVVLYGDHSNWFACWAFWIFQLYGHKDVRLMDGGRDKWALDKRPWDTTAPSYPAADYRSGPANRALRARLSDVLKVVEEGQPAVLVDVRSPEE
jgi:thiosulfate/3-mercaptopyruvate sulfurtransferase